MRDIIIYAVIFAIQSLTFILVGLRILRAKRPFIVSQRWRVILWVALPMGIIMYVIWPKYPGESWIPILTVIGGMTVVCGINWWQSREGIVVGTTGTALHDALRHALNRLSLPYEESTKTFRLPTLNNELIAQATSIDGIFFLRLKRFGNRRAIRRLAAEVNDFYKTAPVRTNRRVSYALIVIGAAF
ncbi:MAG TPA: hypothetical protein VIC84_25365, partial [Blastocatellia bacterium]